jgi:hypothetical protein
MAIKLGSSDIAKVYLGATEVDKIYLGATEVYSGVDADAQAFITAAGITDATQKTAINNFTIGLKADSLWSKMKALYPIVGGSATTHKFNLKNSANTDAAFRLSFNGGWTHSSNGALPNGSNAYADTFCIPSSDLITNSVHLSYYSRTNATSLWDMGVVSSASSVLGLIIRRGSDTKIYSDIYRDSTIANVTIADSLGLATACRDSSTSNKIYKNSTLLATTTTADTGTVPSLSIYIGAANDLVSYGNKQCAFASIGDGLTDTDVSNLSSLVQTFQTELSRQV